MDPKIYSIDTHKISPERIDRHALYVIEKLRLAGHKAYLVGGGVRDLLLNRRPKDFDISTSAKPEEIRALFRNSILIGKRFRLAHIRFGRKIIEVSTFRAGETEAHELIVRDNEWGTEEEDVLRRDFTMNGLFYDLENQSIVDYVDGFSDLQKGVLRTIGNPKARFTQDPVRMIRLIKFSARFDFTIEEKTFEALLHSKKEILKSSSARVLEELFRMLESGASKRFFHLLHEYGLLQPLLPELAHFFELKQKNQTFDLLHELDSFILKNPQTSPDRSFLLSILTFALFDTYIQEVHLQRQKPLHLGEIADAAHHVISCLFQHFFIVPKRIRAILGAILASQYRFVPLNKKEIRRPKIPKDFSFPLALDLLKFRSQIAPELLEHYTLWSEAAFQAKKPQKERIQA